jgi:hypothetical protein
MLRLGVLLRKDLKAYTTHIEGQRMVALATVLRMKKKARLKEQIL